MYLVTLSKYNNLFRALIHVEISKAQVAESGRTKYCNFALWIRCLKKALYFEKKIT